MEFFRQEYWSGLPFPTLGDLPDPGIKSTSPALAGGFLTIAPPGKPIYPLKHITFESNILEKTENKTGIQKRKKKMKL